MFLLSESYKHLCGKIAEKLRNQITNTHILSSFNSSRRPFHQLYVSFSAPYQAALYHEI